MSKQDYSYSYDYSNKHPQYKFFNEKNKTLIEIFREQYCFTLVQKNDKGQQRLKLDEVSLQKMITNLVNNGWNELTCK